MTSSPLTSCTSSILNSDGSININLLQHQVSEEIRDDMTYKAEDAMKKRVVHTSKDYTEFTNFVKCSQQKSVSTHELSQLFQPDSHERRRSKNKLYNNVMPSSAGVASLTTEQRKKKEEQKQQKQHEEVSKIKKENKRKKKSKKSSFSSAAPSVVTFEKEFLQECTDPTSTARYITSSPSSSLDKKLKLHPNDIKSIYQHVELNSDILGLIIEGLAHIICAGHENEATFLSLLNQLLYSRRLRNSDGTSNNDGIESNIQRNPDQPQCKEETITKNTLLCLFLLQWMDALTQCSRFALNIMFLSTKQKKDVEIILSYLEEHSIFCFDDDGTASNRDTFQNNDGHVNNVKDTKERENDFVENQPKGEIDHQDNEYCRKSTLKHWKNELCFKNSKRTNTGTTEQFYNQSDMERIRKLYLS